MCGRGSRSSGQPCHVGAARRRPHLLWLSLCGPLQSQASLFVGEGRARLRRAGAERRHSISPRQLAAGGTVAPSLEARSADTSIISGCVAGRAVQTPEPSPTKWERALEFVHISSIFIVEVWTYRFFWRSSANHPTFHVELFLSGPFGPTPRDWGISSS